MVHQGALHKQQNNTRQLLVHTEVRLGWGNGTKHIRAF